MKRARLLPHVRRGQVLGNACYLWTRLIWAALLSDRLKNLEHFLQRKDLGEKCKVFMWRSRSVLRENGFRLEQPGHPHQRSRGHGPLLHRSQHQLPGKQSEGGKRPVVGEWIAALRATWTSDRLIEARCYVLSASEVVSHHGRYILKGVECLSGTVGQRSRIVSDILIIWPHVDTKVRRHVTLLLLMLRCGVQKTTTRWIVDTLGIRYHGVWIMEVG